MENVANKYVECTKEYVGRTKEYDARTHVLNLDADSIRYARHTKVTLGVTGSYAKP